MADKVLKTIIQIRRDTTANWVTNKDFVPKAGEPCLDTDTGIVKYGDGKTTYENLPESGASATHYEGVKAEGETDTAVITRVLTAASAEPRKDDIFVVKALIADDKYSYTAYVYDGTNWAAMDGNYSAENVYTSDKITLAGNFTAVGNYQKGKVINEGTSMQSILADMLSQRLQPATPTEPAVSVTFNSGAKEVGTKITPAYSATLSAGSYTYGPATGVTAKSWSVVAKNGSAEVATLTTSSGSFDEITVAEGTSYYVTASATHEAGAVAKDNLGADSNPVKQIKAGTKTKDSAKITGYRAWFYGFKGASGLIDVTNITSANVRGLTSSNGSIPATLTTDKMQQMFFAAPKGKIKSVGVANATNGAPQTVTKVTDIMVEGANGFDAVAYDVFYVSNAGAESGSTKYNITVTK